MVSKSRKVLIAAGAVVVFVVWGLNVATLLHWVNVGAMSAMSLLLLVVALIAMVVGAIQALRSKPGTVAFVLHLLFAAAAFLKMHHMFVVPYVLGAVVAVVALLWAPSSSKGMQSGAEIV